MMKIAKKIDSTTTAIAHGQDSKSAAMFMSRNAPPGGFQRKKMAREPILSENEITIWELALNLCCIC